MGVMLLGVGALGANCEPSPPACGRSRPECQVQGQVTACINHCLTPVPDGTLCALDSCDLFVGAGIPNAGVCGTGSACVRFGSSASNVGVCAPISGATAPGCNATSGTSGFNPDDQNECPYGGYCAALGSSPGTCGVADPLQNGLAGMCQRYRRVGEACSGPGADARRGVTRSVNNCAVCEPGARCIAVNRLRPRDDLPGGEAGGDAATDWRCVRTCQSGSNDDCDCPGQTPNLETRASSCLSGASQTDGPICVRPEWCIPRGGTCEVQPDPNANCVNPLVNDIRCIHRPCCERGALCQNNVCLACIEDGTTLTSSSRCCLTAFFDPMPGNPSVGKCHTCKGQGQTATTQAQCCPGLRFSPIPGTTPTLGQCVVCRSAGQVAGSAAECCPGLALFPDINNPTVGVCNACRTTGESALSSAKCCAGLNVRLANETGSVPVCAPPCLSCTPTAPGLGRCSRGDPTICPLDGTTPMVDCLPNEPITETCLPEDEDCDGARFDVADPTGVVGRPCAMPQLPASAMCGGGGRPNWQAGSYPYTIPPLSGHLVCNPATGMLACTAIPGIDYCDVNRNCQVNCAAGVSPCTLGLRHDATTSDGTVVSQDTAGTSTPATWFGAQIYVSMTATVPLNWGAPNVGDQFRCVGLCKNQTCGTSPCGVGLECRSGVCLAEDSCPPDPVTPSLNEAPITCWNHACCTPNSLQVACRVP